ncbi:hypothetical protein [Lentzea nigeriaca]|uniref:hypothetical protein n=1 Tax=Lentzea nigeriaca TaxID=1128665 RepID=UPI001959E76B|nr:hypothetical protein [Lentzea nigeriaca]MBM7860121.1 hypothetical protein [Lentzea nigeriaca]
MGEFDDSLWAELQREHGQALLQNMAKQRSRRTARWIGAAAAATVLGTGALAASTYFGGAPPAYAVVDNPDGSVSLILEDVQRFEEATAKLRERGVPAIAVALRKGCAIPSGGRDIIDSAVVFESAAGWPKITIVPGRIPAGATIVLAASRPDSGDISLLLAGVHADGQVPTCLPDLAR